MVRSAIYLIETTNRKDPLVSTYGSDTNLFCVGCSGDGFVPRNIRLLAAYIDLLEPYVIFHTPVVSSGEVTISWVINGCVEVDEVVFIEKNQPMDKKTTLLSKG